MTFIQTTELKKQENIVKNQDFSDSQIIPILGFSQIDQYMENIKAIDIKLSNEDLDFLGME